MSTFVLRLVIAALLAVGAFSVGLLALESITMYDPAYPDWRRVLQAPIAAAAVIAFALAAYRVRSRKPSAHIAASGCVLTSAFGVAAFS